MTGSPIRSTFTGRAGVVSHWLRVLAFVLLGTPLTGGLGVALAQAPAPSPQLVVGRNSNMLGGDQILKLNPFEVRGDVLGRADNEPSCAFSTRNSQHILCGGNTYRMVDVPGISVTQVTRDAWQGVYQSTNGGDTWESTLHPGFFLDPKPHVFKPLGFRAAADPSVRSGPAGMAWYSGIAFRPDRSVNSLFVSTFADLNNRENDPMPFKFVRTAIVDLKTTPKFIDKPWIHVEAAPPGQTCTMIVATDNDGGTPLWVSTWWGRLLSQWLMNRWPGWTPRNLVVQQVPASIIHVVYSIFLDDTDTVADLMYSRSTNCGLTFSTPKKLNIVAEPANGAAIGKALVTGSQRVFAAWRRAKPTSTSPVQNSILAVVSNNNGGVWSAPVVAAQICPFDQSTTPSTTAPPPNTTFRTTAFPTMAVDAGGRSYVAWADRGRDPNNPANCNPFGAARIMMSTSADGLNWSTPFQAVPSSTLEHQTFPSLAFTAGKLFLAWVDFKEDASGVFGQFVNEAEVLANTPAIRHTADVRAAMADPAPVPNFSGVAKVSRYLMGVTPSISPVVPGFPVQLQWNAVNRKWARRGTVPFFGDYIDIGSVPYLPPDPSTGNSNWRPNNGQVATTPTVLIAWTDNRDMRIAPGTDRPNPDGTFTPVPFTVPVDTPGILELGSGPSIVDPTQTRQVCSPGEIYKTGTTNQNIYAARATVGFTAGSPGNNKPLGLVPRGFVVYVRNDTGFAKSFRVAIPSQPPGGIASFDQFNPGLTVLDPLNVPRRSSVARTVFVRKDASNTPLDPNASVRVDVTELVGGATGATEVVYLNADPTAPEIDGPEIDGREIYGPEIDGAQIGNSFEPAPEIDGPEIDGPEIDGETLLSLGLQAPEIDGGEIIAPEIDGQGIDSPEIDGSALDTSTITDIKFRVRNTGNTTAQYNAAAFVRPDPTAGSFNYQIIVREPYGLRAVKPNCEPTAVPVSNVLVNVLDVDPRQPEIDGPEIDGSAPGAATFSIPPGGFVDVIVRARSTTGAVPPLNVVNLATQQEAVDTDDAAAGITEPPVITTFLSVATTALPTATTGTPYSRQLEVSGGQAPFTWTFIPGSNGLPASLTFSPSGLISGTPAVADVGTFPFTAQVTDSSLPTPQIATRELTISITQAGVASLAFVTQPTSTVFGQPISPQVSVRAISANGSHAAGITISMAIAPGFNPGSGTLSGTLSAVTGSTGIAVFPTLSINNLGNAYKLLASATGFTSATSSPFNITDTPSGGLTVYNNQVAFLVATGATNATGPLPSLGSVNGGATVGAVTFNLAPGGDTLDIGGAIDWYPGLPGNEIALGFENLQATFAAPVTAMGFFFVEPNTTMPPHGGTPVDSTYEVTLYNGAVQVGSFSFNAADDQIAFVGVSSATPFTRATIIDTTGNDDDEYFGEFYTGPGGQVFVVTNSNDSGTNSLRWAIDQANLDPGPNSVIFNIPDSGGNNPRLIDLNSALPAITAAGGPINIDGTTQPGFEGTPFIELDGNSQPGNGLSISAGNSTVRGLTFNGFGGDGIALSSAGGNLILGNWFGLNPDGILQGNGGSGVHILNSPGNTIGGRSALARNVISGNGGEGVWIDGSLATNNLIVGNYIGTDVTGNGAVGNAGEGVLVEASNTTIGGLTGTPGRELGNVISGNVNGVTIGRPTGLPNVTGTVIQGNIIGLDVTGTIDLGNASGGVRMSTAGGQIGGTAPRARNVISGNATGVVLSNSGSTFATFIEGNYIGTDITGTLDRGNGIGVSVGSAPGTRVGGTVAGAGNVISGNGQTGVFIFNTVAKAIDGSYSAVVQGNLIGLNAAGTSTLGNTTGVLLSTSTANSLIGGTTAAARNVISGNTRGVEISGATVTDNVVRGNYIGTDVSGALDRGNGSDGVHIVDAPGNIIGGTAAASSNLISGNDGEGVRIDGALATGNVIQGNFIGTNATLTGPIGNSASGVYIRRAPGNSVAGNIINYNGGFAGVAICGNLFLGGSCGGGDAGTQTSNGNGNAVFSNIINNNVGHGVSLDGVANTAVGTGGGNNISGNGGHGVEIFSVGATGNQIRLNAINSNTLDGVRITGNGNTGNDVTGNSFISNANLAIDLGGDGVTPNDAGDGDSGPNNLQNSPVITLANTTTVMGTLNSTADTMFSIQIYKSFAACGASGQGQDLITSVDVETDMSGNAPFESSGLALEVGVYVTATATVRTLTGFSDTSEFSACLVVPTP